MRSFLLVASLSCALWSAAGDGALAQAAAEATAPEPTATATAPGAVSGSRSRATSQSAQAGGIYARPGRCRELAISRRLYGLARQRFIKRCRIARRAMPRPIPTGPGAAVNAPAPGQVPAMVPPASPNAPAPAKPAGKP